MVFNHRSVNGILDMMKTLGAMVGALESTEALIAQCQANLDRAGDASAARAAPRVF